MAINMFFSLILIFKIHNIMQKECYDKLPVLPAGIAAGLPPPP